MKTFITLSVVLFMVITNSGCMTVNLSATGYDKTASLTSTERKFTIVKHFSKDMKSFYVVLNLIPLSEPNISDLLRDETTSAHGDAFINLKIQGETTLTDIAIPVVLGVVGSALFPKGGAFIGGLVGARTYTVEGDIIKYIE
jgi:hypothetical protein